jgi:competence protein ComEC
MFDSIRQLFISNIIGLLPPLHADLLIGVLLGTNLFPQDFYGLLKTSGLVHVVVVSGYNISVVTHILLSVFQKVSLRYRLTIVLAFILLYTLLTGASAPTIRAAIMAFITVGAQLFGKPVLSLYCLALTALLMIAVDPNQLSSLSFQLTFAATLGILLFEECFHSVLRLRLPSILRKDLSTSLAAQVFVMPLILYNFGTISVVSPVANMFTLWTIPIITYIGFILLGASLISLQLAAAISWIVYIFTSFFISLAVWFSSWPYASVSFGRFQFGLSVGISLVSFGLALAVRQSHLKHHKEVSSVTSLLAYSLQESKNG